MKIYYPSHPCLYTDPFYGIKANLFVEQTSIAADDEETFDITFDELIQLLQEEA